MSDTATRAMPSSVRAARTLALALAGLYVVQTVVAFVARDAMVQYWAERHNYVGDFAELADSAAPAYRWIALISLVLIGGLMVLSALSFDKRAGWARVLGIVMGVLAVLAGLLVLVQDAPIWYTAIVLVGALLGLGVVVQLVRGESSAWFSGRSATAEVAHQP